MNNLANPTSIIAENLKRIESTIADTLTKTGREAENVQLVTVTKGRSTDLIRSAYESGLRTFGENRVDEALSKQLEVPDLEGLTWHMVGKIQSRKAKDVARNFSCVHSLDRVKIARLLDKHRSGIPAKLQVFIEGNFSGEQSKSGFMLADRTSWSEIFNELSQVLLLPNLEVIGIMTMAPWQVDETIIRNTFRKAREFGDQLKEHFHLQRIEYSMGMTDDFVIAIEEGSTVLRLGRAVFEGL
jgi:pyridoxal phosphate enzyme (YggS family)